MTLQEIPATEQLMGLSGDIALPRDLRFAAQGVIWPAPEALKSQEAKSALANASLVEDTLAWIRRVLKPALIAPDLRVRLLAARAIVSGQDAFLARYVVESKKIQIVVTKFHVHVVIAPVSTPPLVALHECLRVDRVDDPSPWTGDPWRTSQVAGLDFGYMPRATVQDWRESIYYLSTKSSVKFSVRKLPELPYGSSPPKSIYAPTEEAERHWFDGQP